MRVTPVFIDPRAARVGALDDDCALARDAIKSLSEARLPLPPLCVDLKVEVLPGPNIITRFHLADGVAPLVVDPPFLGGTLRWGRETFTEPTSRLLQLGLGSPTASAADTTLIADDLRARLTFTEAGSVDEGEARLSVERVRGYLAERGYPAPRTDLTWRRYDDGNVSGQREHGEAVTAILCLPSPTFSPRGAARLVGVGDAFGGPGFAAACVWP